MMQDSTSRARRFRARTLAPLLAVAVVGATGCDSLLEVSAPSRVAFETLSNPANAQLAVNSARVAFECAFGNYIVAGGLVGNELEDSQLAAAFWDFDRRSMTQAGGQYATGDCEGGVVSGIGVYSPIQTAIFTADTTVSLLEGFSDAEVQGRTNLIATASAYAGYGVLLLAEAMCEAPLHGGPTLSKEQLFNEAETRLTRALQGSADVANLARVGLARSKLNRGDAAGALASAQAVPAGFRYDATYATTGNRESNRVERLNHFGRQISVQPQFTMLSVDASGNHTQGGAILDPRVRTTNTNATAQDQTTILWTQSKFSIRDAPIAIGRHAEAQLIVAEVQLGQTAVDVINALHAAAGLPAWVPNDVNDDVEVLGHVIDERFRELYLESQHYFSLNRYHGVASQMGVSPGALTPQLPYFPAAGAAFKHGGVYGDRPCLPLPDAERQNNPNA